jgi:hypothetical protein
LRIGFPLKISELFSFLITGCAFATLLVYFRVKVYGFSDKAVRLLILFLIISSVTCLMHLSWKYPYPQKIYEARLSYQADSILKLFYLILDFLILIIALNAYRENRSKYNSYLLYGAIIASLYSWYLAVSSISGIDPYLLPGMDEEPQRLKLTEQLKIIRCGTFKEGNYMGVFLMISGIIAFFEKKFKTGYYLFLSILPTFSTVAFLGALTFYLLFTLKKYFRLKYILHFILIISILFGAFNVALRFKTFRFFTVDKITADESKFSDSYSKIDRQNSIKVSYAMGRDNKWLGVGLSNYSRHFDYYNTSKFFKYENKKPIPNNIYLEVFCETGIIGSVIFFLFILFLLLKTGNDQTKVLRFGLISLLICFNAFPTFSVLFIWVYFGLILSLEKSDTSSDTVFYQ